MLVEFRLRRVTEKFSSLLINYHCAGSHVSLRLKLLLGGDHYNVFSLAKLEFNRFSDFGFRPGAERRYKIAICHGKGIVRQRLLLLLQLLLLNWHCLWKTCLPMTLYVLLLAKRKISISTRASRLTLWRQAQWLLLANVITITQRPFSAPRNPLEPLQDF